MKLPKKVKVGYKTYKIKEWESAEDRHSHSLGAARHHEAEIFIDTHSVNETEVVNTMLHEILHCISWTYGLQADFGSQEFEEKIVNTVANGLIETMQSNKDVFQFILDNCDGK